jgi:putative ABC transport system permease protein
MVVVQFTLSIGIIVSTLIVSTQLHFLLNKDLGYEKKQILVLKRVYPLEKSIQAFCREVERIPGVVSASNSTTYLGFSNSTETYQIMGRDASNNFMFGTNYVDEQFMHTYNFHLVGEDSRFFDASLAGDSTAVLINQAAVKEYDLEYPLETVILEPTLDGDTNLLRVIGVVDNFHHSSLHDPVDPYLIRYKQEDHDWSGYISIRLGVAGRGLPSTLRKIKDTWMEMSNEAPFQYFFLDDELQQYYKEERRTGRLSLMFAILATFIACLGLFGLTLHNTNRRTREIGIRKVMGASVREVVVFVSREMLTLVSISIFLAWVLAYLFMHRWLEDFPFNIGFQPWIYLLAALLAICIAALTVAGLAWRIAVSNPADVLHYE